jgi:hypothetical protein
MTVTERIQQGSCMYETEFPPSVPEGQPLREAQPARAPGLLARLLRLAGARG